MTDVFNALCSDDLNVEENMKKLPGVSVIFGKKYLVDVHYARWFCKESYALPPILQILVPDIALQH